MQLGLVAGQILPWPAFVPLLHCIAVKGLGLEDAFEQVGCPVEERHTWDSFNNLYHGPSESRMPQQRSHVHAWQPEQLVRWFGVVTLAMASCFVQRGEFILTLLEALHRPPPACPILSSLLPSRRPGAVPEGAL